MPDDELRQRRMLLQRQLAKALEKLDAVDQSAKSSGLGALEVRKAALLASVAIAEGRTPSARRCDEQSLRDIHTSLEASRSAFVEQRRRQQREAQLDNHQQLSKGDVEEDEVGARDIAVVEQG